MGKNRDKDPAGRISVHMMNLNGVYQISVDRFCIDVCEAVEKWVVDIESNSEVQSRITELIKIYGLDDKELPIVSYSG